MSTDIDIDEAAEQEAQEAAQAAARAAARARELAALDTPALLAEATDAELESERARLAAWSPGPRRAITTLPRAKAHERLSLARAALEQAAVDAKWQVLAETRKRPEGPTTESLRRAFTLGQMAAARESFFSDLEGMIDATPRPGEAALFTDDDPAGEVGRERRENEARMGAITDELADRAAMALVASRPGLLKRLTARKV